MSNCGLWGRGRCSAEAAKATPKLVAPGERRRPTSWPGGCCGGEKSGECDMRCAWADVRLESPLV